MRMPCGRPPGDKAGRCSHPSGRTGAATHETCPRLETTPVVVQAGLEWEKSSDSSISHASRTGVIRGRALAWSPLSQEQTVLDRESSGAGCCG